MSIGSFTFHSLYGLGFLVVVILLMIFLRKRKRADATDMARGEIVSGWKIWQVAAMRISFWLMIISISFLLCSPHIGVSEKTIKHHGSDIMILLDVSGSMEMGDVRPSYLDSAKQFVGEFIEQAQGNRVGLVIFSGRAFLYAPLTHEYDFLLRQIQEIHTESIDHRYVRRSGTAIGDAVLIASDYLEKEATDDRGQAIILVTDGDANIGIDPVLAAKHAALQEVPIYSIGVGDPSGRLYTIRRGQEVEHHTIRLDESRLREIADISEGSYFFAGDHDAMGKVFDQLTGMHKGWIEETTQQRSHAYSGPVLLIALLATFVWFVLLGFYPRLYPL